MNRRAVAVVTASAATMSVAVIAAAVSSCREPTEVVVHVTTTSACGAGVSQVGTTAIYVAGDPHAADGRVQTGSPEAQTAACAGGEIGTLVVTPGGNGGALVVIAGVHGKSPMACVQGAYDDCIVARRSFSFSAHTRLNLPIVLDADCAGITCDSTTTCEHGQCYASEVSCGSGQDCNDPLTQADGAVADVTTVATDASIIDASSLVDATLTADAGKDAGITSASDGGKDAGSHDPRCGAASAIDTSLVVDNCSGVACLKTNGCCVSSPGGALPDKPVCRDPMYCTSITSPGRACCTDPECGGVGTCCQITADPFKTTTKPALCILPVQGQIGGCFN